MRGAARLWPALLFACACDKEQPIDPNLGVVRLASPPPSARPSQATFSVETGSALEFDFPALAPGPAGRVRALSGAGTR